MTVIRIRNEKGEFEEIPIIKGEKGDPGEDGISVNCIKVADEQTAISQSAANPNNIYYW